MAVRKSLKRGDHCPAVAVLQAVLLTGHFMQDGTDAIDDNFDESVEEGALAFQRWAIPRGHIEGLKDDGEVGDMTYGAILFYLGVDLRSLPDHFWPQE